MLLKKLKKGFKKAYIKTIRLQEERAAQEVARWLITNNKDFANFNEYQLAKAVKSKKSINFDEISGL